MNSRSNYSNSLAFRARVSTKRVINTAGIYWAECRRIWAAYPGCFQLIDALRFFPAWYRSLGPERNPLGDANAWFTFPAIRFLRQRLDKSMRVFEYGSGGSTLFFCKLAGQVVSVEHSPQWAQRVSQAVSDRGYTQWECLLVEPAANPLLVNPDPADPYGYASDDAEFRRHSFRDYVASIDSYPDAYFDVIVIDGRARPSCVPHVLPKVREHGYLVWDNTDRDYYLPAMKIIPASFRMSDFPGPTPHATWFTRTTIWRRSGNA